MIDIYRETMLPYILFVLVLSVRRRPSNRVPWSTEKRRERRIKTSSSKRRISRVYVRTCSSLSLRYACMSAVPSHHYNLLRRLVGLQITHQNYHNIFDMICLDIYHYLVTKNYMYTDLSFWIWFFSFIFMQISSSIVDLNSLTIATTNQPP